MRHGRGGTHTKDREFTLGNKKLSQGSIEAERQFNKDRWSNLELMIAVGGSIV